MKYTLHLEGGKEPIELCGEKILANDVFMPWDYNPHKVGLWVIGHEFGTIAAVWGSGPSDAMDELIDQGLGESFIIQPEDMEDYKVDADRCLTCGAKKGEPQDFKWGELAHECQFFNYADVTYLGNASEPCDTENMWLTEVVIDPERDYTLLCAFAYAQGAGRETLDS